MNKTYILVILLALLIMTGCSSNKNAPMQLPASSSSGNSHISQTPREPENGDQLYDPAGGFNFQTLENALKKAGSITEKGEEMDLSEIGAIRAKRYGNVVIAEFHEEDIDKAIAIYDQGSVIIQGKEIKVGTMIGPFFLFFLDNQMDANAIRVFQAVGGL